MSHPPVDPLLADEEARTRVGVFVRRALPLHRGLGATGWSIEVGWDDVEIWATARRGELVLRTERRRGGWWAHATRMHALELAESIARILLGKIEQFGEVDEVGRVHVTLWQHPVGGFSMVERPEALPKRYVLDVGWYPAMPLMHPEPRLNDYRLPGHTLRIVEALERGIMRPEDGVVP